MSQLPQRPGAQGCGRPTRNGGEPGSPAEADGRCSGKSGSSLRAPPAATRDVESSRQGQDAQGPESA